ncbi:MAG: hypothetical protein UR27_C0003G0084 [Candidatus Peregrinibacteria bacterium GW2011_GWA2_33_10]|nr:MAG: hypothetical protein UR27_C0003G0084 [Candidatus Peregrinibacteria bacterium GW2011_GWA2_33_10]KKP40810.1 MAG: hypothetical protein UR30_C0004G0068 [Candidatus Peregrinibacteria bacterium GW2011_GWC2_33_13]OGJ48031.1 MAG: hypothetical protein A2229_03275 [Candidatus Peregrinibacteria bacterium RIFOXYA2_FULL_33_7]
MYLRKAKNVFKYRKTTLSAQVEKSSRILIIATFTILSFLAAIHLYIGSHTNAKGYVLKELQEKNDLLYQQSKILEKKIIEAKTFTTIEENKKTEKMDNKELKDVTYVKNNNVATTKR